MRVLIVKLSSLGDVIHTLPLVQDVVRWAPGVAIDWVVERAFAPLVRRCSGVERVIAIDLRRWRTRPLAATTRAELALFWSELRAQRYDVVLDAQGLTKSALVARLARLAPGGARWAMAHATEGSSYEAPTRWLAQRSVDLPRHVHALTRSRLLGARALGADLPFELRHGLVVHPLHTALSVQGARLGSMALLPGSSRADKQWPLAHWRLLVQALVEAGFSIVVAHGSEAEQAQAQAIVQGFGAAQVWPCLPLDELADALATCCGAIGVDSGLSHLAVALGLAHVQIYNWDTAWRTGPLAAPSVTQPDPQACVWHPLATPRPPPARQLAVVASPTPTPAQVWDAWQHVWQTRPDAALGRPARGARA